MKIKSINISILQIDQYLKMTKVFKTKWFNIEKFKYENSDYYKLNHPSSVIILAITKQQKIIAIEQFRHMQKNKTLEFPSGGINKRDTLKSCKTRTY